MPSAPIAITAAGMMTAVGLTAPAACAAIRAGLTNFRETPFFDNDGELIMGGMVPLPEPWRGIDKLVHLASSTIRECVAATGKTASEQIVLVVCVAEADRPGRLSDLDQSLLEEITAQLGMKFHPESRVIANGRTGLVQALLVARAAIERLHVPYCIIAGVDSLLINDSLASFMSRHRILTPNNSDGFIPGEGAAAILCTPAGKSGDDELHILGIGSAAESASIESGEPLRGDGLKLAIEIALADAGIGMESLHYRMADVNGEQYKFREAALALSRSRGRARQDLPLWHPADCVGEIGAAIGPCMLACALAAMRKGYAPGDGTLSHLGNDNESRAAIVLRRSTGRAG